MSDLEQIVAIVRDLVIIFCAITLTVVFLWICVKLNGVIQPLRRTSHNIESVVDKMSGAGNIWTGLANGMALISRVKDKSD